MGYYADTEKGATRTGIMSVLFIIEEVCDCWNVRFCGESETDLVLPLRGDGDRGRTQGQTIAGGQRCEALAEAGRDDELKGRKLGRWAGPARDLLPNTSVPFS